MISGGNRICVIRLNSFDIKSQFWLQSLSSDIVQNVFQIVVARLLTTDERNFYVTLISSKHI